MNSPAGRGRPRSEQTRSAILEATHDLVVESGYDQLSIQAIAARSGSGRQTVYRWWSSKAMLVAELVTTGRIQVPQTPIPDSGDLHDDLVAWLDAAMTALEDPQVRSILLGLVTAASDDEEGNRLLYETSTGPFHRALVARLRSGAAAGQVGPSGDVLAIADALIGTLLFRALTPGAEPATTEAVVRTLLGDASTALPPSGATGRS